MKFFNKEKRLIKEIKTIVKSTRKHFFKSLDIKELEDYSPMDVYHYRLKALEEISELLPFESKIKHSKEGPYIISKLGIISLNKSKKLKYVTIFCFKHASSYLRSPIFIKS